MKKLLSMLAILLFVSTMALQAQLRDEIKVPAGAHLVEFADLSTDLLPDSLDYIVKEFDLTKKTKVQYYTIPVYVDTVATSGDLTSHYLTINSQQSFDRVTWANIDTVLYYGNSGDSTFNFQDLTTGTSAPYLRVKLTVVSTDSVDYSLGKVFGRFLDK